MDELSDTRDLVKRAHRGDHTAFEELVARSRPWLTRVVGLRLNHQLARRLDVSDVVQEVYLEAAARLGDFLGQTDLSFTLWLRWIARDKLLTVYRQHVDAKMRAVAHEVPLLPADTAADVVGTLISNSTPSKASSRAELAETLRMALERMDPEDRELIVWRHFEELTNRDAAKLLNVPE